MDGRIGILGLTFKENVPDLRNTRVVDIVAELRDFGAEVLVHDPMGANLLCNTDVFCFASPFRKGELPPRLLHPRRVLEGVREGVEHGGNKSGVPTVNGSLVFDERYLGKPLVFCGTVGTLPITVAGKPSQGKKAVAGDYIIMTLPAEPMRLLYVPKHEQLAACVEMGRTIGAAVAAKLG